MTNVAGKSPMASKLARRSRYRAIGMGVIIFVCGALCGSGMAVIIGGRLVLDRIQNPPHFADKLVSRLAWRLDMTDEQEARVRDVVATHQDEFRALVAEIRPRFDATLETLKRDIAAQLDEEQAEEFNQHFNRLRSMLTPRIPAPRGPIEATDQAPPPATGGQER